MTVYMLKSFQKCSYGGDYGCPYRARISVVCQTPWGQRLAGRGCRHHADFYRVLGRVVEQATREAEDKALAEAFYKTLTREKVR